jgi:hypothetical protein
MDDKTKRASKRPSRALAKARADKKQLTLALKEAIQTLALRYDPRAQEMVSRIRATLIKHGE